MPPMPGWRSRCPQSAAEPAACPFWAMLGLLVREPGMGWLAERLSERGAPRSPPASSRSRRGGRWAAASSVSTSPGPRAAAGRARTRSRREQWCWLAAVGDAAEQALGGGLEGRCISGPHIGDGPSLVSEQHMLGPWPWKALDLLERSGDARIWQAYHAGLMHFFLFREEMGLPAVWPVPKDQIRGFVVAMELQGLSSPKILMYLAALSYISKITGHPDPLQDFVTFHIVTGLQWREGNQRYCRSHVTIEVLRSLLGTVQSVCDSLYESLLFRALFTVAFFGALRVEEMVAEHHNWAQPELLYMSDVQLTEERVNIYLHTSYLGQERFLISLRLSRETWVCPVEALCNYVAARPRGDGPLFIHWDGTPLTRRQFLAVFRSALRLLGLPPEQYGVHSFWLGAVVTAVRYRCSEETILRLGRWQGIHSKRRQK
ncbi:uncharacterized protein LOC127047394 [Gopherus flavomarginatus]|uniref:uncharacterized protein LOC127047394 n=1 Tax=Gopherus flavomarginatus TaxID=286002 RepID=UPI0021CBD649|nr:uncharacterized protein LOC127047394 [Gopherus flavomarginatus]